MTQHNLLRSFRTPVAVLAFGALAVPVLGHDFWLQPAVFAMPSPKRVPIAMYVGHGADRGRWGVAPDKVIQFRSAGPDGLVDRLPNLTMGSPGFDAIVPLARPGSYVFGLQSASSSSVLPYLRFNEYIAEEGITPIAVDRTRRRATRQEGRELYNRRAKAIVQVGPVDSASIVRVTRPLNLKLEIIPERHPMALAENRVLPVRVRYNGRPLPGALVKITDLGADAKPADMIRTDAQGRARFTIRRAGAWQMNVVWASRLTGRREADYVTTFSSLTFATR